jgi:hypothetical protein
MPVTAPSWLEKFDGEPWYVWPDPVDIPLQKGSR